MSVQRPMTYDELLERVRQLRQERDELVKALRAIHSEINENGMPTVCEENAYELAEATLSRYPEQS